MPMADGCKRRLQKIAFVISTLEPGGAERVAVTLCNAWVRSGLDVDLITMELPDAVSHYPLDPAIQVHRLNSIRNSPNIFSALARNAARVKTLRNTIRDVRPDIVVSFTSNMSSLVLPATRGLGIPVVAAERSHPQYIAISWQRHLLRDLTHRMADRVVVQSEAVREWYQKNLKIDGVVIPNPIDLGAFASLPARTFDQDNGVIVSVGRLDDWKGHDTVIDAFAVLAPRFPGWRLEIYGKGPSGQAFGDRIAAHGLQNRIHLKGVSDRIPDILSAADVFIFGSRYEGYPNAVIEALAAGCPVVATDCPGATAEILGGGEHGVLVPVDDVNAMAQALIELIESPERRQRLSALGPKAVAPLATETISQRWLDLFEDIIKQRSA